MENSPLKLILDYNKNPSCFKGYNLYKYIHLYSVKNSLTDVYAWLTCIDPRFRLLNILNQVKPLKVLMCEFYLFFVKKWGFFFRLYSSTLIERNLVPIIYDYYHYIDWFKGQTLNIGTKKNKEVVKDIRQTIEERYNISCNSIFVDDYKDVSGYRSDIVILAILSYCQYKSFDQVLGLLICLYMDIDYDDDIPILKDYSVLDKMFEYYVYSTKVNSDLVSDYFITPTTNLNVKDYSLMVQSLKDIGLNILLINTLEEFSLKEHQQNFNLSLSHKLNSFLPRQLKIWIKSNPTRLGYLKFYYKLRLWMDKRDYDNIKRNVSKLKYYGSC